MEQKRPPARQPGIRIWFEESSLMYEIDYARASEGGASGTEAVGARSEVRGALKPGAGIPDDPQLRLILQSVPNFPELLVRTLRSKKKWAADRLSEDEERILEEAIETFSRP